MKLAPFPATSLKQPTEFRQEGVVAAQASAKRARRETGSSPEEAASLLPTTVQGQGRPIGSNRQRFTVEVANGILASTPSGSGSWGPCLVGYVFINYASQDRQFVDRFVSDLKRMGIDTWFDTDDLRPGINFVNGLEQAITSADAMIIVVSKHAIASEWVILELELARRNNKMVAPVVIDDADVQRLSAYMRLFQIIDVRKNYDLGLKALIAILPESVKHGTSSRTSGAKGCVFLSYANPQAPVSTFRLVLSDDDSITTGIRLAANLRRALGEPAGGRESPLNGPMWEEGVTFREGLSAYLPNGGTSPFLLRRPPKQPIELM